MTFGSDGRWGLPEAEAAAVIAGEGGLVPQSADELSPYEYLLRALESHIAAERESLGHYRQLAESTKDPVVELVMGIILEDEERHHGLMRRLAARLQDDLNWSHTPEALPVPAAAAAAAETHELLRRFVLSEEAGIRELQSFAKQAEGLYGGLPSELLAMMALDSQKHEHLLRFLYRRLGQTIGKA